MRLVVRDARTRRARAHPHAAARAAQAQVRGHELERVQNLRERAALLRQP
jgi:hypothetical protein